MPSMSPDELLQIHKDYADEFAQLAQSGLVSAFSALSGSNIYRYTPAFVSISAPDFGTPNKDIPLPASPSAPATGTLGALAEFMEIPNPDYGEAPSNNLGNVPTYVAPTPPSPIPGNPLEAPDPDLGITMPNEPNYLNIPSLALPYSTLHLPSKPPLTEPTFEGRRPNDINQVDPDTIINRYTSEQNTHRSALPTFVQGQASALLARYAPEYDELRSRINNAIIAYVDPDTGGGAGIPENIEGAIASRASDRNSIEFQRAMDTVAGTLSRQGFSIPPGAMLAALQSSRAAMGDAQVRSNTEIATKNFELEQKHFEFMLTLGRAVEEKIMDTIVQYLNLALKMDELSIMSAKEIVAAYLGAYNIQVMVYKALWDGYSTDAEVYKAKWQGLTAKVALYEAEIRAEMAKTEINKAHVGLLQAVVSVNQSLAALYSAQIEAAKAPLEIAKIQLGLYEAQLRGFASEVAIYEAQWNGFKAQVEGELGKFKAFEAQAAAYTASVGGFRAGVDAYSERVRGTTAQNQAVIAKNDATLKQFSVQAEVAIKTFEGLVAQYSAESNVAVKQAEIEVEYWRASANLLMGE